MRVSRILTSPSKRGWTIAALAVISVLGCSIVAFAGPVGNAGGFEDDDANLVDNTGNTLIDWNTFQDVSWLPANSATPTRQADKTAAGFTFKGIEDWQATTADSGFGGGVKQDLNCPSVVSAKAPNKDDLKRIYLASTTGSNGHVYLNLAWVRIPQNTTSASAHIGFEFNKGTTACAGSSLVNRTPGDVLIVYDFEGGGTPVLTLRRWVISGACDVSANSAPCWGPATDLTADGFAEGAVNTGGSVVDQLAPPALGSSTSVDATLANSEFGEAGIDLTNAGVFTAGACESFGKAYGVSRSSGSSGTAQMKDLVGPGDFTLSNCDASMTTTPSAGAGGEVIPGQSVTDLAVVKGTSVATPPTPTGGVTWYLCGPIATGVCSTGGTGVGGTPPTEVNLADSSPPTGEASATSPAVNTAGNPLLPGRYCFRAEYEGDSNYDALTHAGTGDDECFIVRKIVTSTVTTPSDGSGVALTGPVAFGTTLFDKAVVTGTPAGGSPPGEVSFWICDPDQVSGAAGAEFCDDDPASGTAVGVPRTLVAGADNTSSVLSSPGVTADKAGVWCFRATYTPSGNTYLGSGDNSHTECVEVSKAPTTTVTTPSDGSGAALTGTVPVGTTVRDRAVVTGHADGGAPDGTVVFYLCEPDELKVDLSGDTVCDIAKGEVIDTAAPLSPVVGDESPPQSDALSSTRTADSAGTWCFAATYVPGSGSDYTGSSDNTDGECFEVSQIASATVTTPSDGSGAALGASVPFGTSLFDKAVVTGTTFGGTPTGAVRFWICAPGDVSGLAGAEFCDDGDGTALAGNDRPLSPDALSDPPSASAVSSPGVAGNEAGVWCFRADYIPSGNTYVGSGDNSHGECVTVNKAPSSTVTTPSDAEGVELADPVPVGTTVRDRAVVTGVAGGGFPGGTVRFHLCGPGELGQDLGGNPVCDTTKGEQIDAAAALEAIDPSSPPKSQALSSTRTADAAGTWCFAATYVPAAGSNYTGSSDATNGECFDVVDSTTTATTQKWLPNDSATITSTGGTTLEGSLQFTLYADGVCGEDDGEVLYEEGPIAIDESDGLADVTTDNDSVEVNASATVSWKVVFTSDDEFVTGSEHCEVTTLDIDNNPNP